MEQDRALRQLAEIEKLLNPQIRLAADGWDEEWKTVVATLMSARTTDKKTVPTAVMLFEKFDDIKKLAEADVSKIAEIIRPVNFYKTKANNISNLAKTLVKDYNSKVPLEFDKLVELSGVGRKTANVVLAVYGHKTIGVDTHITYVSNYLGWTKNQEQQKIEEDLEKIFPKRLWGKLNWIIVTFGQTYPNRKVKNEILDRIKKIE